MNTKQEQVWMSKPALLQLSLYLVWYWLYSCLTATLSSSVQCQQSSQTKRRRQMSLIPRKRNVMLESNKFIEVTKIWSELCTQILNQLTSHLVTVSRGQILNILLVLGSSILIPSNPTYGKIKTISLIKYKNLSASV